jgi:tetratricopeptide (TPR) repeat protein
VSLGQVALAALLLAAPSPAVLAQAGGEAEARAHYERGVAFYDEGQYAAALAEFEAAYEGSHRAPILFNIGQIHARLGRAVEAVEALQRYLAEAGTSVNAERRALVERELQTQRARIGTVAPTVSVPGAVISIDDVEVGSAPLAEPVRVSAGEHVIAARADGFETARYRFRLAGGERRAVELELVARGEGAARLRIEVDVPGAEVRIDGRAIGLSPIDLPVGLPAGSHRVEISRPGYEPLDRTIEVAPGTEAAISFDLVRQANPPPGVLTQVALALPTTSYALRVDGELVSGATVALPNGLHDLAIEAADMEPIARRVDIPAGATFVLDPGYRWSAAGRQARQSGAGSQRVNGAAIVAVGAVVAAGGAGFLIGREVYAGERRLSDRRALNLQCEPQRDASGVLQPPTFDADTCDRLVDSGPYPETLYDVAFNQATNEIVDVYEGIGVAGYVLLGAGVATVVGGVIIIATAPSDESIDASTTIQPRVSLDVGPGSVSVRGTF